MSTLKSLSRFLLKGALYPLLAPYVSMPGRSFQGLMAELTQFESGIATRLRAHVNALAVDVGIRHIGSETSLDKASGYIANQFAGLGYAVASEPFLFRGVTLKNIVAEVRGASTPEKVIVFGAHYDTVHGSPGADDNASGVAGLIELAAIFRHCRPACTIRFVAFPNEEDTGTSWENMGSYHYAKLCHERREQIVGMISLEMLGYFSEEPGSQRYPFPFNLFYPDRGNFIAFIGNAQSREWVRKVVGTFRTLVQFPSEGAAAPEMFKDIARSDHWAFWQFNYPALMMTDTSNFRYPYLHTMQDTPDKLNFEHMARLVAGMARVARVIAEQ